MKKFTFFSFLLIGFLSGFSLPVNAQETPPDAAPKDFQRPKRSRPNLLRELGLSPEQMQAIRRLNAEKKVQIEEAQRRLTEARRSLDAAIYAENANEAAVAERLREFQDAQAEVAKIRTATEFEIRKILTPEQVARFREIRRRFGEKRDNFQNRRRNRRQPPNDAEPPVSNRFTKSLAPKSSGN